MCGASSVPTELIPYPVPPKQEATRKIKSEDTPLPTLPPEILRLVFSYLLWLPKPTPEDELTIHNCGLASPFFQTQINEKRLRRIFIPFLPSIPRFYQHQLEVLTHDPELASYVRHIEVDDHICDLESCILFSPVLPQILNIVAEHRKLSSIHLACYTDLRICVRIWMKKPELSRRFDGSISSLARLSDQMTETRKTHMCPTMRRIRKFLRVIRSSISSLFRRPVPLPPMVDKVGHSPTLLGLGGSVSEDVVNFLCGPYCALDLTRLEHLVISTFEPATCEAIRRVVKEATGSLKWMVLSPSIYLFGDNIDTFSLEGNIIDLSSLTKFNTFGFKLPLWPNLCRDMLLWIQSTRFPSNLQNIVIFLDHRIHSPDYITEGFKALENHFLKVIEDNPNIRNIYMRINVRAEEFDVSERSVYDQVPKIEATGLLKVVIVNDWSRDLHISPLDKTIAAMNFHSQPQQDEI